MTTSNKSGQAALRDSTAAEIDEAVAASVLACERWSASSKGTRALVLRALADAVEGARADLVPLADAETHLGAARLNGEIDRTAYQLRAFADAVEAGQAHPATEDAAVSGAPPAGHPHLVRVAMPLGPVAMFSASNFPFAFSVLGGDTASALAAGCSVVIKAHPAHPHLSRAVFELGMHAIRRAGVPERLLTMVEGASAEVGVRLVRHADIAAVAFTGSFRGGQALQREINDRARPIPFFGELGSINPVIALDEALATQGQTLAASLASSIVQGSGQFCTSPGLLILPDNNNASGFISMLVSALEASTPHAMLSPAIRSGFAQGCARIAGFPTARVLAGAKDQAGGALPMATLVEVSAQDFISHAALREEVFGPFCLVVRTTSPQQINEILKAAGGSLTVTVWGVSQESDNARAIVRDAMRIAGRVLFAGVPTGVAVSHAQHHGGPWPASTQPQSTSVGTATLERFLRPVALQDSPAWLTRMLGAAC